MFIAGLVFQGLCTSLLLIAAAPPLALGFPQDKLRDTAVIMNLCIFGAVALGPFIGGLQAEATPGDRCFGSSPGSRSWPAAGRVDVRGLAARQPRLTAGPAWRSRWPPSAAWPPSSAPRSSPATASWTR